MHNYRRIRVRDHKANRIVKALQQHGYDAEYLGAGTASTISVQIVDKVNDVKLYRHHRAAKYLAEWGSIFTNATGNQVYRIVHELYPDRSNHVSKIF